MKKSLRLLLASAILTVTVVGATAPVKNTGSPSLLPVPLPSCAPLGCDDPGLMLAR